MKRIIRRRQEALYRELGVAKAPDPNGTDYYTLLDLEAIAAELHGAEFARWMLAKKEPLEMLFRLADEGGVVLLPGKGFGTLHPSARASLANLNEYDYVKIGSVIRSLADEYYQEFEFQSRTRPSKARNQNIMFARQIAAIARSSSQL